MSHVTSVSRTLPIVVLLILATPLSAGTGNEASLSWLGCLPDHARSLIPTSNANGVSADGSVVVGVSLASHTQSRAFRWTGMDGMVDLGALPGHTSAATWDVSADGSVVVGISGSWSESVAVMWTCPGDLNGDQTINVADLLILLGVFGACP